MVRDIKGITRKLVSLAAMCMPLSLLVLSACGGGSSTAAVSTSGGTTSTGGGGGSGGYVCVSACPGGTTTTTTTSTGTTSTGTGGTSAPAATVVIGQTNFTTATIGTTASTLNGPFGNPAIDTATGDLLIADTYNNRILKFIGIPTANGASASIAIGQVNLTSAASGVSATSIWQPINPAVSGGELFFSDQANNRVGVYNPVPSGAPGTLAFVIGQPLMTTNGQSCTGSGMWSPYGVAVAGGKMAIADAANNRVLLYSTVPVSAGALPSLVLGQVSLTTCNANAGGTTTASTMNFPSGVWTDGNRLVVLDSKNNRVLIWKTFPTVNDQPADLVLGQPGFTSNLPGTTATTMAQPWVGVDVDGTGRLLVTDTGNNRVLIWNTFPTTIDQPADAVIGQGSFTTGGFGTSATALHTPAGVTSSGGRVIVTDFNNNRVLIF